MMEKLTTLPCTYSNNLTVQLSQSTHIGQGGQLDATLDYALRSIVRIRTSCYSFLAREMADRLGMDKAEELMHRAIRDFGRFYGGRIRLRVEARGMPLDVQNFLNWWEMPGMAQVFPVWGQASVSLPHYMAYPCVPCPNMDAYGPLCPERLAIVICEDIHQAIARGYNPDLEVWYVSLLPRGQAKCEFRFEMTTEAAQRALDVAERNRQALRAAGQAPAEDWHELPRQLANVNAAYAYEQYAPIHCHQYHFIANELARSLGSHEAMDILRAAARQWGVWRGEEMRRDHLARGWPLNVATFVKYYDDPAAGDAWIAENVLLTEWEHRRDVTKSTFAKLFAETGTGQYALPLYEDAIPAQASSYHPAVKVEIPSLMERGDLISRFRIWMD
jgi:hypothetical protein